MKIRHKENQDSNTLYFIKILSILVVFFPQFISKVGLKLEQFFSILLLFICFLFFLKKKKINIKCVYFAFIYIVLLAIDCVRSWNVFIVRDSFEFIKPILFLFFFSLGYSLKGDERDFYSYIVFFNKLFIIVSILGILEARIPFFNYLFTFIYKENEPVLRNKAILSFINPYYFASLLLLPVFVNLIQFFVTKKKRFFLFFIIVFMCTVFTQSKTILLGFVLSFVIFLIIVIFNKWIIGRKSIIILSDLIILGVLLAFTFIITYAEKNLRYMYEGFSKFFGAFSSRNLSTIIESSNSTLYRYNQLVFAIEKQDIIPLIGVGIGKKIVLLESFYAMYLYRTGLIGISLHFGLLYFLEKKSICFSKIHMRNKSEKSLFLGAFYLAFSIFLISLLFSYFSSAVTDQTRVAFFFYLFLGYIFSLERKSTTRLIQ